MSTAERVLRNTAATTYVTFYSGSSPVDADGVVPVVVKRSNGTTLLSTNATNESDPGLYSVVIPAQSKLDELTITWTATLTGTPVSLESSVEIVGGFLFSISELRAADTALANTTRFPTQTLIDARQDVETEFEDICMRAFVPRFTGEYVIHYNEDYDGRGYLKVISLGSPEPIRVTGARIGSVSYSDVDTAGWETAGSIELTGDSRTLAVRGDPLMVGLAVGNRIWLEYEYGMTRVPAQIKIKAIRRARLNLLGMGSTIDPRATTMNIPDIGSVNLATPGMQGLETGIPDIDVVLRRYKLGSGAAFY